MVARGVGRGQLFIDALSLEAETQQAPSQQPTFALYLSRTKEASHEAKVAAYWVASMARPSGKVPGVGI